MSKGPKTQTVTQNTEPPAYVQTAQQNLLNTVGNFTLPFVSQSPANTVAGFTPDQTMAFDLTRGLAQNAFTAPPISTSGSNPLLDTFAVGGTPQPITPYWEANAPDTIQPYSFGAATMGPAAMASVAPGQVGGQQIQALLNPYIQGVIDPAVAQMRRQLGQTQAQIGAQNASTAAFGGSRAALQSSEANRAFSDQAAQLTGQLMSQGYDRATATALANAQAAQQIGLANQSAYNTSRENEAQRQQAAWSQNAQAINAANLANAQLGAQNQQFNTAAHNAAQQAAINLGIVGATTVPQLQDTLATAAQQRQMQALNALLGTGQMQQQTAQQSLGQPMDMLKTLIAATPNNYGGTTTSQQPSNAPSPLQTIGGLGLTMLGMPSASIGGSLLSGLFGLSDRRDKTDIEKLGTDPQTRLPIYAYRYKSDPAGTPKAVGPMAQDIQKRYPAAVREIGGHKIVNYGALASLMLGQEAA